MRKSILFTLLILIFCSFVAFASGSKDGEDNSAIGPCENCEEAETISIQGTLVLENVQIPQIETPEATYNLMLPYHLLDDIEIEHGQYVSIEGIEVTGGRFKWNEDQKSMMVKKAEINGEVYDLTEEFGHMGNSPRSSRGRGGMMGSPKGKFDKGIGRRGGKYPSQENIRNKPEVN